MSVLVEQLCARALREYLLKELPAKVLEVNGTRAPVLKAAYAGPYEFLTDVAFKLAVDNVEPASWTTVNVTAGTYTATQLAALFVVSGITAGVDDGDRLTLTRSLAPLSVNTNRAVVLGPDDDTGANLYLGWDSGGERVVHAALRAPGYKGIADGLPTHVDMGPGFWLIIGKRSSVPVRRANSVVRTDEYQVGLELGFMYREMNVQSHRSREGIQSCVRCVRELLLTTAGRQLGRAGPAPLGDIVLVEEKSCTVEGVPYAFKGKDALPGLFDRALMLLSIRVFERPAS